jgi:hypothetical protein
MILIIVLIVILILNQKICLKIPKFIITENVAKMTFKLYPSILHLLTIRILMSLKNKC